MEQMDYMQAWKKSCVKIGTPTNILAALTAFLPVLWLCTTYNCWPDAGHIFAAWGLVAVSFGSFYVVEPISYYAVLGMSGTYLSFLSGNIGNMRLPCAALALEATDSETGTLQAEIVSTLGICGSIITNLFFTTLAAVVGTVLISVLPPVIQGALTKYAAGAIYGGTFGNFAIKYPKVAVFSIAIPLIFRLIFHAPVWLILLASVFGSVAIARLFYSMDKKNATKA